ncbi:hypothetical protein C6P44_001969, partial [Monosporozyma unispora]
TAAEYKTTTECDNHGASMAADFKTRKPTTSSTARAFMASGKVVTSHPSSGGFEIKSSTPAAVVLSFSSDNIVYSSASSTNIVSSSVAKVNPVVPVNTSNPVRTVNPTNLPQDNQPSKDNDHPHGTSMAAEYKITKDSNEHGNSMAGEFKTRSPTGRSSLMSVSAYEGAGGYSPAACHPMPGQTPGFNAKLYYYPYGNLDYSHQTEFLAVGYQSILTPGPVVTGVTNPFFNILFDVIPFYPSWKSDNFSVELTGYYVAPQTGVYRLSYKVDDAGIIFFGSGSAFDCCTQEI